MSKTYCAYPWTNLYVANFNQVMPCCNFLNPPQVNNSVSDFFNGDFMNNIRSNMLEGKQVTGCENCYRKEAAGLESEREQANKEFGIITEPSLRVLDLMLDNVCNLKCRMCNSAYSHNWHSDEKALYGRSIDNNKLQENNFVENIDLSKLERIVFQGGEPLYSPKLEGVFKKLDLQNKIENVEMWMTTNATIMPSDKIKSYLKRFKTVALTVSLDGIDSLFEYIRKNSEFAQVKNVLDYYHSIIDDNISVTINCTISVYNVNEVDKIQSYYKKHYPKFYFHENFVNFPAELNVQNTPDDFKKYINKNIKNESVLQYINEPGDDLFKYFIHYTIKLDTIRNETIKNANPWLYDFMSTKQSATDNEAQKYYDEIFEMFWTEK